MSNVIFGGDLMLFVGTGTTKQPLAYSTSAKLSVSLKTREISSKDSSGYFTEKSAGKFDWNASTDGLISYDVTGATSSIDVVYEYMLTRKPINLIFANKSGSTPYWSVDSSKKNFSGQALITSIDMNASDNDNATYSISLEGTGELKLN